MSDAVIGSLVFEMRANAARLNTDLGKATSEFKKLEREVKGIGRNIGFIINTALAGTGVVAIKAMGAALTDLAKRGEVAGSIAESFERLGGSNGAIAAAKEETLGMVSSFDLMKIASEGLLKNVPDLNQNFSLLAKYGAQLADTLGGDTKQKIDEVTQAIAKANEKALMSIGIVIDTDKAYSNYAKSLGITKDATQRWQDVLTDQQQKLARQAESIIVVKQRTEQLAPVTMSVANAQEAFNTAIKDAGDNFGIAINESESLKNIYIELGRAVEAVDWNSVAEGMLKIVELSSPLVYLFKYLAETIPQVARALDYAFGDSTQAQADRLAEKISQIKDAIADVQGGFKPLARIGQLFGLDDVLTDQLKEAEQQFKELFFQLQKPLKQGELFDAVDAGYRELEKTIKNIGKEDVSAARKAAAERKRGLKEYERQWKDLEQEALKTEQRRSDNFIRGINAAINGDITNSFDLLAQSFAKDLNDALKQEFTEGEWGQIGAGIGTIISAALAKNIKGTNSKGGGIFGSVLGGAAGASIGGPTGFLIGSQIGAQLGTEIGKAFKTGLQNAESKARVDLEQWLEDVLKNSNIRFFDASGKLGGLFNGDIIGKSLTGVFNNPGWASAMDAWGSEAKGVFLGLGEALKEVRGISEDVGSQIAYILGENLAGNIDNARLLVQELGLSFEELSEALLSSALKGKISWLEFNSYIRDTGEAFESGRSMFADIGGAFQSLIDSAGKGQIAVKGFRDTAIEAMEGGAKTIKDLKAKLLEKGFDPQVIDAAIQAAAQRGVKTLEDWSTATDTTAGAIVGDMEALSGNLRSTWEEMRKSLDSLTEQLNNIPKQVTSEINLKVKTQYDNATRDVMENLGAAMPSGILPEGEIDLKQQSGTLTKGFKLSGGLKPMSLSGGYKYSGNNKAVKSAANNNNFIASAINVDARGAAPGVESAIRRALADVEGRLMNSIAASIASARARGGRAADSF